jgi:hypothetical protein
MACRRKNVGVVDEEELWEYEDRLGVVVAY